jgi:hypothetical protein
MAFEDLRHVVHMQAIAHASVIVGRLDHGDIPIAIIVARDGTMKNAVSDNFAALELYDLIAILGLTAVSVMHASSSIVVC